MGTPAFAVKTLETILDSHHQVVGVVTAIDKPAGRGKKIKESDVSVFAKERALNVLQPENLKDEQFVAQLEALKADLFVVVAFRMLPKVIWTIPPKGTINLHASLLPALRGAAPINWAIMNGLTETGVTTFFINEVIDTGKIIEQRKVSISENMNCGELHDLLKDEGAQLLLETINQLSRGGNQAIEQESKVSTEAPKIFKKDGKFNENIENENSYYLFAIYDLSLDFQKDGRYKYLSKIRNDLTYSFLENNIETADFYKILEICRSVIFYLFMWINSKMAVK